jgi:hypothetical protein
VNTSTATTRRAAFTTHEHRDLDTGRTIEHRHYVDNDGLADHGHLDDHLARTSSRTCKYSGEIIEELGQPCDVSPSGYCITDDDDLGAAVAK